MKKLLLIGVLLLSQPQFAQHLLTKDFNSSQSKSDAGYGKIVKSIVKDKAGNLWIGTTWNGVYRYNGKTFTNFTEVNGLCSNEVHEIFEDAGGNLWFGTSKGVCRYNGKYFIDIALPTNEPSTFIFGKTRFQDIKKTVVSILQDKRGNMWFGIWGASGKAGAYRYDGIKFTNFMSEVPLQGIIEDKTGGIWLNSRRYIGETYTDFSTAKNVFTDQVVKSLRDKDDHIWFAVREVGIYMYDGVSFNYFAEKEGLKDSRVTCIFQDAAGTLWVGSDIRFGTQKGGLFRYNGASFIPIPQIYEHGMYSVWTATEDKSGNIWFGGRGGKLLRFNGKVFSDFSNELK